MTAPLDLDAVLDVAADAVVNDGYDALSFRLVASRLGTDVAAVEGTVGTIEQLLVAMLNREYAAMFRSLSDNIERDPLGGRLSRIYRYVLTAVYERPLARSLYLLDRNALHRIMRATDGFAYIPQLRIRAAFLDRMKIAGVVRFDADSIAVSAAISAVTAGAALLAPDDELDDVTDGLALMLERSVDTAVADTSAGKAAFFAYAASLMANDDDEDDDDDDEAAFG